MSSRNDAVNPIKKHRSELARELRQSLERYELVFKATSDVLYDLNMHTGKVIWNDALYTHFGYNRSEPADTLEWWTMHIHPDDALLVEAHVSNCLESKQTAWNIEYRFRNADGQYNYVRDRGSILRSKDNRPLRIIGSLLDITQQKRLDRAKDEFISLVSHQLRTPLTVIRIYGEMFANGLLGELSTDQSANIMRMTDASIRLIKLVGGILDISKLELGRFAVQPIPQLVNGLIRGSIENVTPLADEKGITIVGPPNPAITSVSLDPIIFEQILHNLLTNAIRYSPPESGHITVVFEQTENTYLLSVTDNGIGIPDAAKKYIFNRFYRANNAINIADEGTGLGLYLAKSMTEAFGGTMWFKSEENKGSTFYVAIPLDGMHAS